MFIKKRKKKVKKKRYWLLNDKEWCDELVINEQRKKGLALSVAVHVSPKSLRFAELEGTKPTLIDLPALIIFPILGAAFLFPMACSCSCSFQYK